MRRINAFLIMIFCLYNLMAKDKILSTYYLELSENSPMSLGISTIQRDINSMENNALEQAAVIYSRLDSAYGVDKEIGLSSGSSEEENSESASVKYSVSADIDALKEHYKSLINNGEQRIGHYYIAFYSKTDKEFTRKFEQIERSKIPEKPEVQNKDNMLFLYGKGISSRLDEALDEAIDKAVLEYSKYFNLQMKNMFKEENEKSKQAYELQAINKLNSLEINRMEFETVKQESSLFHYVVRIELKKRIKDENNSDNPLPLRFNPTGR